MPTATRSYIVGPLSLSTNRDWMKNVSMWTTRKTRTTVAVMIMMRELKVLSSSPVDGIPLRPGRTVDEPEPHGVDRMDAGRGEENNLKGSQEGIRCEELRIRIEQLPAVGLEQKQVCGEMEDKK